MSDLDCQLRKASPQNQQVRDLCHYLMKITNPDEIVHKQLGTNLMLKQCFAILWLGVFVSTHTLLTTLRSPRMSWFLIFLQEIQPKPSKDSYPYRCPEWLPRFGQLA